MLFENSSQQFGRIRVGVQPFVVTIFDGGFIGFHQQRLQHLQLWYGVYHLFLSYLGRIVMYIFETERVGNNIG